MTDESKISGGVNRQTWVESLNGIGNKPILQDIRSRVVGEHQTSEGTVLCAREGAIDQVEVAPSLRNLHLSPEWLARYDTPGDWLSSVGTRHIEHDVDKLAELNRNFEEPNGLLAAIQNSDTPNFMGDWRLTISGINDAWGALQKFCTYNPDRTKYLENLRNAFDAIRDRLTSTNHRTNPLSKAADALFNLVTKIAEAGLTGRHGERIIAPTFV